MSVATSKEDGLAIQFLLGHESILTTERYYFKYAQHLNGTFGSEQDLKNAVKDALVFE
jgi:integrase